MSLLDDLAKSAAQALHLPVAPEPVPVHVHAHDYHPGPAPEPDDPSQRSIYTSRPFVVYHDEIERCHGWFIARTTTAHWRRG